MRKRRVTDGPFLDFGHDSLRIRFRSKGCDVPLERTPEGRLTTATAERVRQALAKLLGTPGGALRPALCALPATGVSLRHVPVPRAGREETIRTLALQVEREFPLSLDEIAWGYSIRDATNGALPPLATRPAKRGRLEAELGGKVRGRGGERRDRRSRNENDRQPAGELRTALLVALRREVLSDYEDLLRSSGIAPTFSVGGLEVGASFSGQGGTCVLLRIEATHTELFLFEEGRPVAARTTPWGTADTAGKLPEGPAEGGGDDGATAEGSSEPPRSLFLPLLAFLERSLSSRPREREPRTPEGIRRATASRADSRLRVVVTGRGSRLPGLERTIEKRLRDLTGDEATCSQLEEPEAPGLSTVTLSLERRAKERAEGASPTFLAATDQKPRHATGERKPLVLWGALAALFALAALAFRFGPALLDVEELERRLEEKRAELAALPSLDGRLRFLREIESSRKGAPHLEIIAAIARAAPDGTLVERVSTGASGSVALQGTVPRREDANTFRRRLLTGGGFSSVVLQELRPEGDRVAFALQTSVAPGARFADESATGARSSEEATARDETAGVSAAGRE